ncbi:MAG: hypothetical protein P4L76_08710, partial [Beijerinckiaceae bacterium]|nr:hypothetical protein [Beijerinckiaceae bacterium]
CCEVDDVLRALAGRASPKRPQGDLFSDPAARDDEPLWDELDLSALAPAAGSGLAPAAGSSLAPAAGRKPAGKNARNAKETPSAVYGNGEESERGGMEEDNRRPLDRVVEMLGPTPISIDELSRAAELTIRDVRAALLELELGGRLERHGGGLVSLIMTRS